MEIFNWFIKVDARIRTLAVKGSLKWNEGYSYTQISTYGFEKLRDFKLIELRNGFKKDFDKSVLFFIEQMGKQIYTNNIDLSHLEKTKSLTSDFSIYFIHYSVNPIQQVFSELQSNFDYILISSSEDKEWSDMLAA